MPNLPEARCDSFSASRTRDVPYYPFRNGFSNDFLQIPMNSPRHSVAPSPVSSGPTIFWQLVADRSTLRFWLMR
jgi:hypothetical protein